MLPHEWRRDAVEQMNCCFGIRRGNKLKTVPALMDAAGHRAEARALRSISQGIALSSLLPNAALLTIDRVFHQRSGKTGRVARPELDVGRAARDAVPDELRKADRVARAIWAAGAE